MSKSLLEKSRAINQKLQKIGDNPVDYFDMCQVLSDILTCSVFIIGRRGQIIGYAFSGDQGCKDIDSLLSHAERFPESYNQGFVAIQETQTNFCLEQGRSCIFNYNQGGCNCSDHKWVIVPVFGGAKRMATLILKRRDTDFTDEDIVLAEYGAVVVANEVMRLRSERIEEEARKKAAVQIALATLSYSEKEAIEHVLAELKGTEGLLIASRIADRVGITRSVIVSALRKFESAGVIESRSLGMKGTYIKVLNDNLFDELKR
ncbi:MAG: GTP-sensing pleiotropic transcriptional regulator CodY [Syntrophomonadaceae bacterium]|jgi:transcriptional pleiotropic repressor